MPAGPGPQSAATQGAFRGRRHYEIVRRIGVGGMAEVYLCRMHASEGVARLVAVKLIREDFAQHPQFRAALAQEARFASLLVHSNVVNVLDFDEDEQGRLFLVMEFVDGVDLWQVGAGHALPPSVAIHIATEVLCGLGYAHTLPLGQGRGIVHRDVSPQNVLLDWHGAVRLTDFGIAKAITTSGLLSGVKGKASYMSPEQAAQQPIDARSDLFSLGVVLWELVTGRRLFEGQHAKDVLNRIILGPIPAPSSVRAVHADLEAVILRLLAKPRGDRYANAGDAAAALLGCQDAPKNGPAELSAYLAMRFPQGRPSARPPARETGLIDENATTRSEALTQGGTGTAPDSVASAIDLEHCPDAGADKPAGPLTRWLQRFQRPRL